MPDDEPPATAPGARSRPVPGVPPAGRDRAPTPGGAPPRGLGRAFPLGPDLTARARTTDARDGDLHVEGDPATLRARRHEILDRPWVWMRQVHGAGVVVVGDDDPVEAVVGADADAVVTRRTDVVLAAHSADCATIALVGSAGGRPGSTVVDRPDLADGAAIGVVHAGWRGLEAGVVGAAVAALRQLGVDRVDAHVGPCIGPECYEFDGPELNALTARFGPSVAGRTREGRPALDLRLGVRLALGEAGAELVTQSVRCTACGTSTDAPGRGGWGSGGPRLFSHRARADAGRQAMLVWLERPSLGGPS